MMKFDRVIIGILSGIFACCISAQSVDRELAQECPVKTLWVVDGVALNDSVFDYTLSQMRSDSAAMLASRVLSWVYPQWIESISVIDSVSASEYGFVNCDGVVKIATTIREPLLVVINGYLYESKEKASAGEILGGYDRIRYILHNEFKGLNECVIKEGTIFLQMTIGYHLQKYPLVIITTEKPYYRSDIFEGNYLGKRGKQTYKLTLSGDSTYVFSKKDIRKKTNTQEIRNCGKWHISQGDIILVSRRDPTSRHQEPTESPDSLRLRIDNARTLTLPKNSWNNRKKSVSLKR